MSDDTPLSQIYLNNYFHLLGITILFYDHILTFKDEYLHIWQSPRTGASSLFLLNRYFALLSNIVMTAGNFSVFTTVERFVTGRECTTCQHYSTYRLCSLIITQVIVGLIQALRTFALYRRDWRIAAWMAVVAVMLSTAAIYVAIGPTPGVTLNNGCNITSPRNTAIRYAVAWEALFIWDSFIFTLTFLKTYKERFRYASVIGANDLLTLIIRDGAIYFAIMACAQCVNSLTYYVLPPALIGVLSTFSSSISVTMMSRLMLNLHRSTLPQTRTADPTTIPAGYMMTTDMGFAPVTTDVATFDDSAYESGSGHIELQSRSYKDSRSFSIS